MDNTISQIDHSRVELPFRFHAGLNLADSRFTLPLILVLLWCCWRLWQFTIRPRLSPAEPPELPYLLPVIAHGPALFKNADALFNYGRAYFKNTRKPFTVEAGGERLYILMDSKDVADIYKNTESLSIDLFFQQMIRACGGSSLCCKRMFQDPDEIDRQDIFFNPKRKSVGRLSHDLHRRQLTGAELDGLTTQFIGRFSKALRPERIAGDQDWRSSLDGSGSIVSIYPWLARIFAEAGQIAYFGEQLGQISPDYFETFLRFDHLSWQLMYRLPSLMAPEMHTTVTKLVDGLHQYFDLPQESRSDGVWFTQAYERELRASGLDSRDVAVIYMLIYWGLNTNVHKACFWMLCYLASDQTTLALIRDEIAPAFDANGQLDHRHLVAHCPRLVAAYNESLRLCAASQSVRLITDDTHIGEYLLRKGNRVLIPLRQMHIDSSVWGADIDRFVPERWMRNEKLEKSTSWRPFGGGVTQCPGRHLAMQTSISMAAMMILKFDFRLADGQDIPRMDLTRPWLGVVAKREDDPEPLMVLRARCVS